MKELRDLRISLLTGESNRLITLFDRTTYGLLEISTKGYLGTDAKIFYKNEGDVRWMFYIDEGTFLCDGRYWTEMEEVILGSDDPEEQDTYVETSSITKLLFDECFGRQDVIPQRAEYFQEIQVMTYLKRALE
jgi:hypothetical protein